MSAELSKEFPGARCPYTVKGLEGLDPYPHYDRMREYGDIVWYEGMKAWLVLTADGCRRMMQNDVSRLRFWTADLSDEAKEIQGRRGLKLATGEYHYKLHSWWVRQFAATGIEPFREPGIRPLVHNLIDRFIERGKVDLIEEFAALLPVRAVCVIMGLPWQDDAWVDKCFQTMKPIEQFFNYSSVGGDDIMQAARAAANKMNQTLMPFVEARRNAGGAGDGADMITRLWRDGPGLRSDWNTEDVVTNVRHLFFAGSETTVHSLASALNVLLTQPEIKEQIRAVGDKGIPNFIEEVMRLYGPVQFRSRKANEDIKIEGVLIPKDGAVVSAQGAANRDPKKYPNPNAIDLNRRAPRDHIAFNTGPRTCVGASLARMEMQEAAKALLERLPDLRLDPQAPRPTLQGFQLRAFAPIKALFTPGRKSG
ncbi:MAG: cytochrome P450 [Betaproteobacteria bacterium]|nr:cytochrome P450 [Betaproteobacteria bacterium]